MNILITSGGTTEKIDNVRGISNSSTGRLGCAIAQAFADVPYTNHIFYVCNKAAVAPKNYKASIHFIESVDELCLTIKNICTENRIDVIIHAMAVSDYKTTAVAQPSRVVGDVGMSLIDAIKAANMQGHGKISSDADSLLLLLEKTPKVIAMLRGLAPGAVIVGFKLLDNVTRDVLIDTGFRLLNNNSCDFVLANDATQVGEDAHVGYLIDRNRKYEMHNTKAEIAAAIVRAVVKA